MNILCIDTSEKPLHIEVFANGKIFCLYSADCNMQHSGTLLNSIDSLLKQSGTALADIGCYCCVNGPGSFTGIRIGVTTARAFAQIYKKPALAVNSLRLKAYNIETKGEIFAPLTDAVRGKVYYSAYLDGNEILSPSVCGIDNIDAEIKYKLEKDYGKISVNYIYEKELTGLKVIAPKKPPQLANLCLELIEKGKSGEYEKLLPLYAALSQAEISYADKLKKMG